MSEHFVGERLRCRLCRATQWSDPQIESGWYRLEVDGRRHDVCPRCMGNMRTPLCGRCRRFFHEDALASGGCPWCARDTARTEKGRVRRQEEGEA